MDIFIYMQAATLDSRNGLIRLLAPCMLMLGSWSLFSLAAAAFKIYESVTTFEILIFSVMYLVKIGLLSSKNIRRGHTDCTML